MGCTETFIVKQSQPLPSPVSLTLLIFTSTFIIQCISTKRRLDILVIIVYCHIIYMHSHTCVLGGLIASAGLFRLCLSMVR